MRRLSPCLLGLAILALPPANAPAPAREPEKSGGGIVVDKDKRTVTIDARIAPRKIDDPRYKEIYPIEVIACYPFPEGQKAHETVVTIEARPSEVHKGLEALGIKPGAPGVGEAKDPPMGPEGKICRGCP